MDPVSLISYHNVKKYLHVGENLIRMKEPPWMFQQTFLSKDAKLSNTTRFSAVCV